MARLTPPGFLITLNPCNGFARRNLPMENLDGLMDDNEPLTEEDWTAIREGKEAIRQGEFISLEEWEEELGLK